MRIVVAGNMVVRSASRLRALTDPAHDWVFFEASAPASLEDELAEADVFVSSSLGAEIASRLPSRLRLIQTPGAGYEGIALDALPAHVTVANTHNHERSVAEWVIMSVLALSRDLLTDDRSLRVGHWHNTVYAPKVPLARTLRGRTIGLLGFGHIGQEVARLARVFDMRCIAVTRRPDDERAREGGLEWLGGMGDVGRLMSESDVVVVALPNDPTTRGMIGSRELGLMRPDAYLVNCARGAIVDQAALFAALSERRLAGAALDVWWSYPDRSGNGLPAELPFGELDNVVMTAHTSGNTTETYEGRNRDIAANIERLARGEPLQNVIRG